MRRRVCFAAVLAVAAMLTGCAPRNAVGVPGAVQLTGAGSTFDDPFFASVFYLYGRTHRLEVNYQPIGSGGGILQFMEGTVAFGASDVPMSRRELKRAEQTVGPVVQVPVAMAAEAVCYDVPGLRVPLRLTGPVLADIFLGRIRYWDAQPIRKLNPSARLPHHPIIVVHRSDGSGTTYIFTDYLHTQSVDWSRRVGVGKAVSWPTGIGAKGNAGVAAEIESVSGAVGYVELAYALQAKLPYASIRNPAGRFVAPSLTGAAAAAAAMPGATPERFSIVNPPGDRSYPICGYSWILLARHPKKCGQEQALVRLVRYLVTTGQARAAALDYAPLPAAARRFAERQLLRIACPGGPHLQ